MVFAVKAFAHKMSRTPSFYEARQDTVTLLGTAAAPATYTWVYPSCYQSKYLQPFIAYFCVSAAL